VCILSWAITVVMFSSFYLKCVTIKSCLLSLRISSHFFSDFNIHQEKPYATDFISLLASFNLKWLVATGTHKSGNQLDLVYTCNCITDNILVKPLHVSDHFYKKYSGELIL